MTKYLSYDISEPHWHQYHPHQTLSCRVKGLSNSYRDGEDAIIDASITHLICDLNYHGYLTAFCCSGLVSEHEEKIASHFAYISFSDEAHLATQPFIALPSVFRWDGKSVIRGERSATEEVLRRGWETFKTRFSHLMNRQDNG